jgi:hypothetical protein
MTDTSKLVSEANAISSSSPAVRRFAQDAAANLVDLAGRVAKLEGTTAPAPSPTPAPTPTPSPSPSPSSLALSLGFHTHRADVSDTFDGAAGTKPSSTRWDGKLYQAGDNACFWNGMTNASLDGNGNLDIVARKDAAGKWTSAFLSGKIAYSGPRYIESRGKVSGVKGAWSGPVWEWDFPYGSVGTENDIIEQLASEPAAYHTTLHVHGGAQSGAKVATASVLAADYHVYACAVYADRVDYYLDNNPTPVSTIKKTDLGGIWGFDTSPMCLNINLNMGGWGGTIDPAVAEAHLLVDYVNVFTP